ncbi:hypothetical protein AtNW77_Chr1g0082341 [Arabidopsis thaliana]|uniref:Uncharacterized protein n=4 Tax=Arabidopsis TaxID=3701 RepID=Q8LFZ7_ARATH|nr:unknown [Arabidopsis thaliana]KAG7652520.1 hypothetical protein ISN45_At01g072470 [Arabidopsis thaliana x Arabidopsis arenosa]KAG7660194.1 hypothetical protein ISN44_As01g069700 [Arabidopsis suecica]OAP15905.1 hypothetical protein AXX17_AT1G74820 [Arabidopsis thaliana]CAA0343673.1 unnamed protein product [Arabidopsis thaliana]
MGEASDSDSSDESLKHNSTPPLFSISGFFCVAKGGDSDPGRSPTSPLDFGVFGGLFSPRSSSSSPLHRNKWLSHKVGLSLLSSSFELGDDPFRRDYIVLAPQVKVNNVNTATPKLSSDPCVIVEEPRRSSSSSPMDIISTYSRSLSGREMALSEDYTCIISHGPNPKTTHIFGDCILDCDPKDLGKEDIEIHEEGDDSFSTEKPQDHREVSAEKESENAGAEESCYEEEDLFPMAMPLNP